MTVILDVEAALPDEFQSAREIWRGLGLWAPASVAHALATLCRQGKVEREGGPWGGKPLRYRRRRLI